MLAMPPAVTMHAYIYSCLIILIVIVLTFLDTILLLCTSIYSCSEEMYLEKSIQ